MTYTPRDGAETWTPFMPAPSNFDKAVYQKRIDNIVGTRDGRPIIKLAWAPDELRWRPHAHGDTPPGYTFPIFIAYHDADGSEVAAPRWVLLERLEPEQFAPTWEATRYSMYQGRLWDWSGPCPSERYIELRAHCYHDGVCCPCRKLWTCQCGVEYDHCWGRYAEPDEQLLNWIRRKSWEAQHDPDVKPTDDVRYLESAHAQQELRSTVLNRQEQQKESALELNRHFLNHWERKPHSTHGFVKSGSGLYVPN